jgi:AraC family transcriptional regulator, transcriptional activator of pobA
MPKKANTPLKLNSIRELHRILSLPEPAHPLVSVIDLADTRSIVHEDVHEIVFNFYCMWLEKTVSGKIRYGRQYVDFDNGAMIFIAPGQMLATHGHDEPPSGWGLAFHPDLIRSFDLATGIHKYGYFNYAVTEGLQLSGEEEALIVAVLQQIRREYSGPKDEFTQRLVVGHIGVLLDYADRFYTRQFTTRKPASPDVLMHVERLLTDYIDGFQGLHKGLPTVQYLADHLHVSPGYLSDMLRADTGQNAQQHIHFRLIEKSKELICSGELSISEIAYHLGFEHTQSFSKFFKAKTSLSPLQFRQA